MKTGLVVSSSLALVAWLVRDFRSNLLSEKHKPAFDRFEAFLHGKISRVQLYDYKEVQIMMRRFFRRASVASLVLLLVSLVVFKSIPMVFLFFGGWMGFMIVWSALNWYSGERIALESAGILLLAALAPLLSYWLQTTVPQSPELMALRPPPLEIGERSYDMSTFEGAVGMSKALGVGLGALYVLGAICATGIMALMRFVWTVLLKVSGVFSQHPATKFFNMVASMLMFGSIVATIVMALRS